MCRKGRTGGGGWAGTAWPSVGSALETHWLALGGPSYAQTG